MDARQDGLRGGRREEEAAPAPFFTISFAFLKGYMQGHVTFRGLNKKKKNLFYCKMCFLFILLVWALKTVLVAVGLAQHIRVSHFLLNSKCTFVAFKQRTVTWVSISTVSTAHTRAKALGGNQEGIRCFKVLPLLPSSTLCSCFLFCFAKRGIET